jgi:hypothetical protein
MSYRTLLLFFLSRYSLFYYNRLLIKVEHNSPLIEETGGIQVVQNIHRFITVLYPIIFHLMFITFNIIFIHHYLPFNVTSHSALLHSTLFPFHHNFPFDGLSHAAFITCFWPCVLSSLFLIPRSVLLMFFTIQSFTTFRPIRRFVRRHFEGFKKKGLEIVFVRFIKDFLVSRTLNCRRRLNKL